MGTMRKSGGKTTARTKTKSHPTGSAGSTLASLIVFKNNR